MEITQEQIVEALGANEELLKTVTTHVIETEHGKGVVDNKATLIYDGRISEEVKKIYDGFDTDTFDILGVRPGKGEDGKQIKTYDFNKGLITELKDLRGKKDDLNKDSEVIKLKSEIDQLKIDGGGSHWKSTFDAAKQDWTTKETGYVDQIKTLTTNQTKGRIENEISAARASLKFNPDVPEAAVNALYNSIKNNMVSNSKIEGDKIVYFNDKGTLITNAQYAAESAKGILQKEMADVLLKENNKPGGGAQDQIVGSIKITKVDGKDDQRSLILTQTTFKTQQEFMDLAEEALKAEGISKSNTEYYTLLDKAHKEHDISQLPRT